MDLGLNGKTAIIGASSQGLGKACAIELAKEGVDVMICGRTRETLNLALAEIKAVFNGRVLSIVADLATSAGRKNLLEYAASEFGTVDILVTNTGGPPPGKFEDHNLAVWKASYELLLESAVELINGVLPGMKKKGWGRLIGITSQAVKQPMDDLILSNALRASVTGLYKTLSNEVGAYGITANTVLPGVTMTNRLKNLNADLDDIKRQIPLGRIADPEEFAAMVTFIASDRASYITGTAIPVDGGWIKCLL